MTKVIYGFGSNNGDDIPYYLMKADIVVAVEASPKLCDEIGQRFGDEVKSGRLFIENCVLNAENATGDVPFYIHKHDHARSQFPRPSEMEIDHFEVYPR